VCASNEMILKSLREGPIQTLEGGFFATIGRYNPGQVVDRRYGAIFLNRPDIGRLEAIIKNVGERVYLCTYSFCKPTSLVVCHVIADEEPKRVSYDNACVELKIGEVYRIYSKHEPAEVVLEFRVTRGNQQQKMMVTRQRSSAN
jgi:hypothetical protein